MCSHGYKHTPMTCSRQHHELMAEPKEINLQGRELSPRLQWQGPSSCPSLQKGGYLRAGSHARLNTHTVSTATHTDSLTPPCTFQQQYVPALPPLLPPLNPLFAHRSSYQCFIFQRIHVHFLQPGQRAALNEPP